MKKRLIDYDKLYHAVMDAALSSTDEDVIFDLMDSSTVDAVPVIRCRDCEHFNADIHFIPCSMGLMFASEDGFCNHGRRRTGNEIRSD